jgi:hypothetical protein
MTTPPLDPAAQAAPILQLLRSEPLAVLVAGAVLLALLFGRKPPRLTFPLLEVHSAS